MNIRFNMDAFPARRKTPSFIYWGCMFLLLFFFILSSGPLPSAQAETPRRIVSLAPSVTEILFAAGLGDRLIGVTTFCDYPREALKIRKIGGMSNPSLEAVVSLQPDIVLMTIDGNPKEFQQKLHSLNIKTYVFEARTLPQLPEGIRKMGIALEEEEKFSSLAAGIEQRIKKLRRNLSQEKIKILFIIWPEPLIVAGADTAVDDAIHIIGGTNIAGGARGRYPKYSLEEVIHQSPDIIFIGEGKGMDKLSDSLLKRLSSVPAVQNKKVFHVSDKLFRLGPRAVDGVEELAGYITR